MIIAGCDLSGPSNYHDTALATFEVRDGLPDLVALESGLDDEALLERISALPEGSAVGLDAPLSYQSGGGDRPADRALRAKLRALDGPRPAVMTPTMTRMAYLTLRGIAVARAIAAVREDLRVVEVHPGAALALRDVPLELLGAIKHEHPARHAVRGWLAERMGPLPAEVADTDHALMACAAALAVRDWLQGTSPWLHPAEPPLHPFDFAC